MAFAVLPSHFAQLSRICLNHSSLRIRSLTMSTKSSEKQNASGLTPTESKNLNERQAMPHEESIIQGLKEVRDSRASACKPGLTH